ncbi:MAG: hypothetical protein E6R10_06265 [Rhodocyclaceae bacterium]|jgi:hemerythrin|nr:MAG: hypothetical protein E6R10_06265 [Rhodocyclaceae bacterium]
MAVRVHWDNNYDTGVEVVDARHRQIVAHCNALADCIDHPEGGAAGDRQFDETLAVLMALARESFSIKEVLLAEGGSHEVDDLRFEGEEFDFLASEIMTTENFERIELQSFLALWWRGHLVGAANKFRSLGRQRSVVSDRQ